MEKQNLSCELIEAQPRDFDFSQGFGDDGPCRTVDVKRYLVRSGLVSTMRTADRRIADWLELGDIHRISTEDRNFLVSLRPVTVELVPHQFNPASDTSDNDHGHSTSMSVESRT